jgi:hypothetical protein
MEYEISTKKSTKKAAIGVCLEWLIRDLKLENSKASVQVILDKTLADQAICKEIIEGHYLIVIRSTLSLVQTLQALCHEFVHVKQYVSGKLTHCPETGDFVWCGKRYPRDTPYYDQPWEIQAFSKETLLFRRATESLTERK